MLQYGIIFILPKNLFSVSIAVVLLMIHSLSIVQLKCFSFERFLMNREFKFD